MTEYASLVASVSTKGVKQSTKELKQLETQGEKTERRAKTMGAAFGALAGAFSGGLFARTVIANTIEQERVTAQLEATLRSTGRYTPELSESMQDYAYSLQQITTFGDEAIISSQAMLLTFTRIGEDIFPRAQEAVLDVSTAMGIDLKSSAIQVGKALNDPITGMTALTRSGITFTEEQKNLVKAFVEVNDIASAQRLILDELETQFGGSAEAAKNTLGGALGSLKNAFGDLLEGEGGSVRSATDAINDLTDTINDPAIKQGFQTFVNGVLDTLGVLAKAPAAFANFGIWIGETVARLQGYETIQDRIAGKQDQIATTRAALSRAESMGIQENIDGNKAILSTQEQELKNLQDLLTVRAEVAQAPFVPRGGTGGNATASNKGATKTNDDLGPLIRIENEEYTERNLILERYNDLLLEAEDVANQVKTPQQVFQEQIELLNELRDTMNLTTGEALISQEQYAAAVEQAQDRLSAATKQTADEMTEFAIQAARNMESALADGFFDIMQGNFDDLGSSFKATIDRMVSDLIASQLLDFASQSFGGGEGGAGLLEGLVGSFIGGARADGGAVSANTPYLVGERGPEIVVPSNSGTVIPNNQIGGSSLTVNINVSGVQNEGGLRQSASQVAQAAAAAAQRAMSRNG